MKRFKGTMLGGGLQGRPSSTSSVRDLFMCAESQTPIARSARTTNRMECNAHLERNTVGIVWEFGGAGRVNRRA
eukprot:6758920-Alexandrium_andersonii.AAC.1